MAPPQDGLRPASLERVRRAWRDAAGAPTAFQRRGCVVVPGPGADQATKVSVVSLGDATMVSVPPGLFDRFTDLVAGQPGRDLTNPSVVTDALGSVVRFRGPASLAYADDGCFQPSPTPAGVLLPAGHDAVRQLALACGADKADESAIAAVTSLVSVIEVDGAVIAACGYEVWSGHRRTSACSRIRSGEAGDSGPVSPAPASDAPWTLA